MSVLSSGGSLLELLPWPCPLTGLENWLEGNAGVQPDQGGFLLHYLDKLVYPDISSSMLTTAAAIVCTLNLAFYGRQVWIARLRWSHRDARNGADPI